MLSSYNIVFIGDTHTVLLSSIYVCLHGTCVQLRAVVHELGHSMGFDHEHNRPDRDSQITVVIFNVLPTQSHNFKKASASAVNDHGIAYDVLSVMHYGPRVSREFGHIL